jgi:hypothetical protein
VQLMRAAERLAEQSAAMGCACLYRSTSVSILIHRQLISVQVPASQPTKVDSDGE